VSASLLALAAAVVLAGSSIVTKRLAGSFPHRQLIGPLLLLNGLLVAPAALFVRWHLSPTVLLLQALSAACLVVGSFCVFDLFSQGSAAAVAVAQAMTPIPALVFSFLLLAAPITSLQAVGCVVVTAAVLVALGPAFGELSRRRAVATVVLAAALNGLLVVLTKLLSEHGLGIAEIYVTRTLAAGVLACAIARPRDIPLRAIPKLAYRSALQTAYFVLLIAAVERGSPATVQTLVATTPVVLLAAHVVARRERPPSRLTIAAFGVIAGVVLAVT
jgi:drug/metabolite transporter (DMT)-like permease